MQSYQGKYRIFCILVWGLTGLTEVGAFLLCNTWLSNDVNACSYSCSRRSECYEELGPATTAELSTPVQLRRVSLERWLQLPESWASAKKKNTAQQSASSSSSKVAYQKHIQTLHADHPIRLGVTRKQRSAEFINTAEKGNATRLDILLRAGVDVDAMDLYRITGLHYAACRGHMEVVRMLLRWGAKVRPTLESANGSSLSAAFANGHTEIYSMLNSHSSSSAGTTCSGPPATHFNDTAVQHQLFGRDTMSSLSSFSSRIKTTPVIPMNSDHVGAGSFYIDSAFCVEFIEKLVNLHGSLRKIGQQYSGPHQRVTMQSTNAARRSHYCDTEGWLCTALGTALQHQTATHENSQSPSPLQHVFSHVRFISYLGEDAATSFLAPHKDHPVLDRSSGRMSTHTFILYLTTVARGGETVLLDHLPAKQNNSRLGTSIVQSDVKPVRGRLFVFPHSCPHAGRHVVEGSKLILRGDLC